MKQHITLDQLNTLTEEQKASLKYRCYLAEGDTVVQDDTLYVLTRVTTVRNNITYHNYYSVDSRGIIIKLNRDKIIPVPSIGQLYELLDVSLPIVTERWKSYWKVMPRDALKPVHKSHHLVDALWEMAKEVL